jgi:opacity protein-like surface antigen
MKRIGARIGPVLSMIWLAGTAWSSTATVEARMGYLRPNSQDVRDVYKNGLVFGADLTVPLWKGLGLWAGADYYHKKGKLTYTLEDTTLRVVPLFAGLKIQSTSVRVRPYAALAAGYFLYKETNVIGTVSGSKLGLLAQIGLLVRITGSLSVDFHGRYTSFRNKAAETDPLTTDLGGLQGGLGFAFSF